MKPSTNKTIKDFLFLLLAGAVYAPISIAMIYVPWCIFTIKEVRFDTNIWSMPIFKLLVSGTWAVLFVITLVTMIKYGYFSFSKIINRVDRADSDAYGNSRWLTAAELHQTFGSVAWAHLPITDVEGIIVSSEVKKGQLYVSTAAQKHCLVVGTTGSGKSTRFIGPTIQMNANSKTKPSMIINDMKGELYEKHSKRLKELGYNVIKFDLNAPHNSDRYNPLSLIWDLYQELMDSIDKGEEPNPAIKPQIALLINEVAEALCPITQGEQAQWSQGAQSIITSIIWGMLEDGRIEEYHVTKEMFTILQISNIANRQKPYLESFLRQRSKYSPVFDYAGMILDNPSEKTVGSYYATLSTALKSFLEEGLQKITSATDIDLSKIEDEPTAIFIIIPHQQQSRNIVGTMIVSQIYNQLCYLASGREGRKLKKHIYFFLDEFGNLPKIPNFDKWVNLSRSLGMYFTLIVQADTQLETVYGKEAAATISQGCEIQMLLGANNMETLKRFLDLFGDYTMYQRSANIDQQMIDPDFKGSTGMTSKKLITLDQLQRLPEGTILFKMNRMFPCKTQLVAEWEKRVEDKFIITGKLLDSDTIRVYPDKQKTYYDLQAREAFWSALESLTGNKKRGTGDARSPLQSSTVQERPETTEDEFDTGAGAAPGTNGSEEPSDGNNISNKKKNMKFLLS